MLFLESYKDYTSNLIIPKGTELFHSTGELFNENDLRVSGYDKILWTTEDSGISQMYIPVSGSKMRISTDRVYRVPRKGNPNYYEPLGINFSDVKYDQQGNPISYKSNIEGFEEITNKYFDIRNEYYKAKNDVEQYTKNNQGKLDKKVLHVLISKEQKLKTEFYNYNLEKKKNEIINKKLIDFGYQPIVVDSYSGNNTWEIKLNINNIIRGDYRRKGRLFILKPKRDLKIFDNTLGGKVEGDLTNVEYHNINLFRDLEEKGYDGIKINDFAQSESEGNFGHTSIGLFSHVIKDLEKEIVYDVTHPTAKDVNYMFRNRNFQSKEYLNR